MNWNIPWQLLAGIDGNQGDDFFDDGDEGNDDDGEDEATIVAGEKVASAAVPAW